MKEERRIKYNWVQTVMRQAELAKKSDQGKKIDPMSQDHRAWFARSQIVVGHQTFTIQRI